MEMTPQTMRRPRRNWLPVWILMALALLGIALDLMHRVAGLSEPTFTEKVAHRLRVIEYENLIKEDTPESLEYLSYWRETKLKWPEALSKGESFSSETLAAE